MIGSFEEQTVSHIQASSFEMKLHQDNIFFKFYHPDYNQFFVFSEPASSVTITNSFLFSHLPLFADRQSLTFCLGDNEIFLISPTHIYTSLLSHSGTSTQTPYEQLRDNIKHKIDRRVKSLLSLQAYKEISVLLH